MEIAYVCTNYNNTKYTRDAVRTLLGNAGHTIRIVVVDNNSTPQSIGELQQINADYPDIKVIYHPENVGYFSGLNVGIAYLREHHPSLQYMAVGNNDLTFAPDFVDSIAARESLFSRYPVVSPDIITVDGVHQNPHVIVKISKLREFVYDLYFSNYYLGRLIKSAAGCLNRFTARRDTQNWQSGQTIYQGHGAVYLLGPLFFAHFDALWAPTFLMGEEFFLSKQVSDQGMQLYYEPGIRLTHHWHATIGQQPSRKMWEISRDSHRVYRQHLKRANGTSWPSSAR